MTLAQAAEIFAYWAAHPPVHLLLAALVGHKPPEPISAASGEGGALPPGFAVSGGDLGMPAPTLDRDAMRARNRARASEIARRNAASPPQTARKTG